MNRFDRLYNLILLSIITLDILSKIRKAIQTLIKSGLLEGLNDPRVLQIKTIIKRNNSIDINGKTKLDLLLKANLIYLNRNEASKENYLDSIKLFSLKTLYPKGVVIYKVLLSKAGMNAVRKIVDAQWGKEANPWCLISRDIDGSLTQAWRYWNSHSTYPKHIAFQNGKLLAFCASSEITNKWWDRNDKPSNKLKLLDGSLMRTPKFLWDEEYKVKKFLDKYKDKLEYNKLTGLYDIHGNIMILNKDLINGHFPIKFGEVTEAFRCWYCRSLTSLEGAPRKVGTFFDISHNPNLKSLLGGPLYVGDIFRCNECSKLINLIGAPKHVGGDFDCWGCKKLISLLGAPEIVGGDFICEGCTNLSTLKGAPEKINGSFKCYWCSKLTSLLGAPKEVHGHFRCGDCSNLLNLVGAPRRIEKDFDCSRCRNLISLLGAPEYVGDRFECCWCKSLTSLKGSPRIIKGGLECYSCHALTSLLGGPDEVAWINNYDCINLKITEQDKKKYKFELDK